MDCNKVFNLKSNSEFDINFFEKKLPLENVYLCEKIFSYFSLLENKIILSNVCRLWRKITGEKSYRESIQENLSYNDFLNDAQKKNIIQMIMENNLIKFVKSQNLRTPLEFSGCSVLENLTKTRNVTFSKMFKIFFNPSTFKIIKKPKIGCYCQSLYIRVDFVYCKKTKTTDFFLTAECVPSLKKKKTWGFKKIIDKEICINYITIIEEAFNLQFKLFVEGMTDNHLLAISNGLYKNKINILSFNIYYFKCINMADILEGRVSHGVLNNNDKEYPILIWKPLNSYHNTVYYYQVVDVLFWSVLSKTTDQLNNR